MEWNPTLGLVVLGSASADAVGKINNLQSTLEKVAPKSPTALPVADGDQYGFGSGQCAKDYLDVARVLEMPRWRQIVKIIWPASLPYIPSGVGWVKWSGTQR
ncbi:hypothetical protein [Leptolyngbya sp. KIOST-1]|uniref:hypothetical protein n=1 Tax=Leptolyngbya sp. KIOST-1 TaxID=1229172 RepID=UPI0021F0C2E0|nr:hypothetical protein [Leptolyngbya sp. KIOST-1]